jgi:hypothetical protein
VKDFLGKEITVGCLIAYPARMSSSVWMNVARVVGFSTRKDTWARKNVPSLKLKRVSSTDSYFKPGTTTEIYALDNVLVLEEADVPKQEEAVHQE